MKRITAIAIPVDVSADVLTQIETTFFNSLTHITETEEQYVARKMGPMIERLNKSQTRWVREIALKAELLWHLYNDDKFFQSIQNARPIKATIIAALFYLCNPFDIIPDHIPVIGFADDAVVINHCIRRLRAHPELRPFLKSKRIKPNPK